jgi:RimJ/RimL family protein N-acetyltransferase
MITFPDCNLAVPNPVNGEAYQLVRLDELLVSPSQVDRIVSICNEPRVFDSLFSEMFPEGVYPRSSAEDWISWAKAGWREGTHFVFAAIDSQGLVVAACDLKSADVNNAEIGYWASSDHRGVMTNSVLKMLEVARGAGFQKFFAKVLEENHRSQGVLQRLGFVPCADVASKPGLIVYRSEQADSVAPEWK